MNFKKRNLVMSIMVLSIFLLQSTALASAYYIPPIKPPPTTTTYRVYGYVKDADTNSPISGATVKIYRGTSTYLGQKTTDSNGYYNFYYTTTLSITLVKSVATKSGYYSSTRTGYMLEGRVSISHYLSTVPPPPPPTIDPVIGSPSVSHLSPISTQITVSVTWHYDPYVSRSVYVEINGNSLIMQPMGGNQYYKTLFGDEYRSEFTYSIKAIEKWYGDEPPVLKQVDATTGLYTASNNPWTNSIGHYIRGSPGAGTNYPIRFMIHYGAGENNGENVYLYEQCRTDFADIRFVREDKSVIFNHFIADVVEGKYAIVWVEIGPSLDEDRYLWLYYGNPNAPDISDGDATFEFFDDFSGSALDTSKWNLIGGIAAVSNGIVDLTDYYWGITLSSDWHDGGGNYVLETRIKYSGSYGASIWFREQNDQTSIFSEGYMVWLYSSYNQIRERSNGGFPPAIEDNAPVVPQNMWVDFHIVVIDDFYGFPDIGMEMHDSTFSGGRIGFGSVGGNPMSVMIDRVIVRNVVAHEPQHGEWDFVNDEFTSPQLLPVWEVENSNSPEIPLELQSPPGYLLLDYDALYDAPIGQNTAPRGYEITQDNLIEDGAFRVEVRTSWNIYNGPGLGYPELKVGFELVDKFGYKAAEIYYENPGSGSNVVPSIKSFIAGQEGTPFEDIWTEYGDSQGDTTFVVERDSVGWMRVIYYDRVYGGRNVNPHLLFERTHPTEIASIRLVLQYSTPKTSCEKIYAGFNSVKQEPVLQLKALGSAQGVFVEPIKGADFDYDTDISFWTGDGVASPDYSIDSGGRSWKVVNHAIWSVSEVLPDDTAFRYAAIQNKMVGFTFYAKYGGTDTFVRAEISYWIAGDSYEYRCFGDWVLITGLSDGWTKVSVLTQTELPNDVNLLEVRIVGKAAETSTYGNIYIDNTKFSIVKTQLLGAEECYFRLDGEEGEACGTAMFEIMLTFASSADGYNLHLFPVISACAFDGYIIRNVEMEWAVTDGWADTDQNRVIESNNKEYEPGYDSIDDYNEDTAIWHQGLSVLLFVVGRFTPWGVVGGLALGTMAHSTLDVIRDITRPFARDTEQAKAEFGDPGYFDFDYPESEHVQSVAAGTKLVWYMSDDLGMTHSPSLTVHYVVQWQKITDPNNIWGTSNSLSINFPLG